MLTLTPNTTPKAWVSGLEGRLAFTDYMQKHRKRQFVYQIKSSPVKDREQVDYEYIMIMEVSNICPFKDHQRQKYDKGKGICQPYTMSQLQKHSQMEMK